MLSKVAERLYWAARYLERVENTARLVGVYDKLLFDLPRDVNISWYSLVELNSATGLFEERYQVRNEPMWSSSCWQRYGPSSISHCTVLRENIHQPRCAAGEAGADQRTLPLCRIIFGWVSTPQDVTSFWTRSYAAARCSSACCPAP